MNELTNVFKFGTNELRTVIQNGEPWFVAKDVCEVLEINNTSQALSRLDEDERALILNDTPSGNQLMAHVNEAGLYTLILSSRKSEAKQFKRWITHEVIPSIRKTGQYIKPLSEKEQLMAAMKLTLESAEEIAVMKEEVSEVKTEMKEVRGMVENQITLESGEQRRIQKAVGFKVYSIANEPKERDRLFKELYRELKDRFGVGSYKDIKKKDMQSALNYIDAWVPRVIN